MSYLLPNTNIGFYRALCENLQQKGANLNGTIVFVGGTLYAHWFKAYNPEAKVVVVEADKQTAVLQSFAAYQIKKGKMPEEIRKNLFLSPFVDATPEGWKVLPGYYGMEVPQADYDAIKHEWAEFLKQSGHFNESDLSLVFGRDGYFGEEEVRGNKVYVDFYSLQHQKDIYPRILEEIDSVAVPDRMIVEDVSKVNEPLQADIIFANNVVDWFSNISDFIKAVNRVGNPSGYFLEVYTAGRQAWVKKSHTREEIEEAFRNAGRRFERLDVETTAIRGAMSVTPNPEYRDGKLMVIPFSDTFLLKAV